MKIVVLGGGVSTERHVALVTATSVCRALRSLGHKAIFVDMFLGLEHYEGALEDAFDVQDGFCGQVAIEHCAPNLETVKASREDKSRSRLGKNVLEICRLADCVFLGLHGADGEDGKIQATLELLGVPYTGSGPLGSAMAMNKPIAKRVVASAGVLTPKGFVLDYSEEDIPALCASVPLPCVLKVINGGSSIGVEFPETREQLDRALHALLSFQSPVLVEEKILGRELTVPVLDKRALSPIEIIPPDGGKFDYVAKYQSGDEGAKEICPAPISEEERNLLCTAALKAHEALGLSVYSRSDFVLDKEGRAWWLEVNTLPGMTPNSLIPRAAAVEGLDYAQLCQRILDLSLQVKR